MLSSVVLPAPVPPDTMMFSRLWTAAFRKSSIGWVSDSRSTRSCAPRRSVRKRRIETAGPSSASGGMIALTREPSGEARVHHRAALVDAPADRADDALDDLHQVPVVLEDDVGLLEHAVALDVHLIVPVDEDVRDVADPCSSASSGPSPNSSSSTSMIRVLALEEAEGRLLRLAFDHVVDQLPDFRLCLPGG